jgi:hypothetical protein
METSGRLEMQHRTKELAQEHLPDVVTHAGLCKPNAPGHSACSGVDAFEHRQMLKAAGRYQSERVIVAATPVDICALSLTFRGRVTAIRFWSRWTTPIRLVRRGSALVGAPAFMIGDATHHDAIELVPIDSWAAEELLKLIGTHTPASS